MVQVAIQERQRKEQQLRKQQAEREAKEREMDKKLRLQHFENEKREEEKRIRKEVQEKAREAAMERKKDEQRNALLYGPKKASQAKSSSSSTSTGTTAKERRKLPEDDDVDDSPSGIVLTREERRERKHLAELRRLYSPAKRTSGTQSYSKPGRRLPGGAVDITTTQQYPEALAGKSVKDRLAAMPNTLTKLNTVKRDTRTIDEIVADIAKKKDSKVLDGDSARNFDDWFGSKKKDLIKKIQTGSATDSGANTPTSSAPTPSSATTKKVGASSAAMTAKSSVMRTPITKISPQATASSKPANGSRAGSLDKHMPSKGSSKFSKPSVSDRERTRERDRERERERDRYVASRPPPSTVPHTKKRPRSESRSESPPPKRRVASQEDDLPGDLSSTIWSLFGRKRDQYLSMDVFSDEEDMEADASDLEREEHVSARIAKKEDLEAFEEERRHEEQKRRRKKEKERLSRR